MTPLDHILVGIFFFTAAFMLGTFLEYWIHRLFHIKPKNRLKKMFPNIGKVHTEHHVVGTGQGVLGEFRDYLQASLIFFLVMFLFSREASIGWGIGSIVYAAFAAYAHQLQHDNPTKCFWMKMPVHYVHHKFNQWDDNFGIGVDWWDRIFGTYKETEWLTEEELSKPELSALEIKWY